MKRLSHPFSSTMHIHIPDDIYQQPYYRNMSELKCTIDRLNAWQKTKAEMFADSILVERNQSNIDIHKSVKADYEQGEVCIKTESRLSFLDFLAGKAYSVPITDLNIVELCGCPSGISNPNGNRASRRKAKKKR